MNIDVTVGDLKLSDYVNEGDEYSRPVTLADVVADKIMGSLVRGTEYADLRKRVRDITAEEIRAQVAPLVAETLTEGFRKSNTFGEPYGDPVTLRTVIADETREFLNSKGDRYDRSGKTAVQKMVAEAVDNALRKELGEVLAEEKAKVVAAVRAKAAELVTEAVKQGIGR